MAPLKILQVGSSMPDDWGGIERYVSYQSRGLVERGHDVTLTAPKDSPLADRSKVHVHHIRVHKKYDFPAMGKYLKWFRAIEPKFDIVNVHFSPDYLMPAWAAKFAKQRGTVLTRHLVLPMRAHRVRTYSKLYQGFIGVSEATSQVLVKSGLDPQAVFTVVAGMPELKSNLTREQSRQKLEIEVGKSAVGIFGRLVSEKGHQNLFRAVQQMDRPVEVHVFGSGPELGSLRSTALSQGLDVRFHGYVDDVPSAMVAMDVVCVPSLCEEALGLVLLEAFCLGVPVVASPVGGIPEVVLDRETGLLADPNSASEMALALEAVLYDVDLRRHVILSARRVYESSFNQEAFGQRSESAFHSVLSRGDQRMA